MADSDNPNLPARRDDKPSSVQLHGNGLNAGNLIDSAISRLDNDQVKALGVKAAEAVLDLQKRQSQQNMDYVTGRKAVEDHVQTWDALSKQGRTTRQTVTTDVETGAGRMRIESKSGPTCFVATAAYGDWRHPDVVFLRRYRDSVLLESPSGRLFVWTYWRVGPVLARLVAPFPLVRGVTRAALGKLVQWLRTRHAGLWR